MTKRYDSRFNGSRLESLCSKRTKRLCLVFFALASCFAFLVISFPRLSDKLVSSTPSRLYVAFVSTGIDNNDMFKLLLEAGIQSLLTSLRLPDDRVEIHLGLYTHCSSWPRPSVTDIQHSDLDESYKPQVDQLASVGEAVSESFDSVGLYCIDVLSSAVCHAQRKLQWLEHYNQTKKSFFFLLEHDWLLFPSKIDLSIPQFSAIVEEHDIQYILMDRGDREPGRRLLRKPPLYEVIEYANNPFLSTKAFLDHLTGDGGGLCGFNYDAPDWERIANGLLHSAPFKTALLHPAAPKSAVMYHWDGRFATWAVKNGQGVLAKFLKGNATENIANLPGKLIRFVDIMCRSGADVCSPYAARYSFVDDLEKYKLRQGIGKCNFDELIADSMKIDIEDARLYTLGYLPKRWLCSSMSVA